MLHYLDSLLEVTPKLHQDIGLQKKSTTSWFRRLVLTVLTIFIFPWTLSLYWFLKHSTNLWQYQTAKNKREVCRY
jgi:hypothetical protein